MRPRFMLLISIVCLLLSPMASRAQWHFNGNPVAADSSDHTYVNATTDGAGGTIACWTGPGGIGSSDIYAQRIDVLGVPRWTGNGVRVCAAPNLQGFDTIASDGVGGAIITWWDYRNGADYDIYAQRLNASGVAQWTADGVPVCTSPGDQGGPTVISDGLGGAIVTWGDQRSGNYDVYAQRIDASGAPQWDTDGLAICTAPGAQNPGYPVGTVSDGAGGAIFTWQDHRGSDADIYAQRVNASGVAQWTTNGVPLCTAAFDQVGPTIIADGGGAIVAWADSRNGSDYDIYAQRVDASGNPLWAANGVPLCTVTDTQNYPAMVSDGAGGAIVAWQDFRSGVNFDVYAQRVDSTGAAQWTVNGVAVCDTAYDQLYCAPTADGAGGAIVTWQDSRTGTGDVYAQHVDALGAALWRAKGVPVCAAAGLQENPKITSDGNGNSVVTWDDYRSGHWTVYSQRVEGRYGTWGHPEPALTAARDNPADQGGKVILNWTGSDRDVANQQAIHQYTIWRAMDTVAAASSGPSSLAAAGFTVVDEPEGAGKPGERIVWHEKTATTDYYWELVGTQEAYYNAAYSYTAPTRQDSTSSGPATQYFRVAAEGWSTLRNWPSNVLSAHSVDNLAPAAPLYLMAARNGADVDLHWNAVTAPDLKDYTLYRATASGVTPIASDFLSNATDTAYVDAGAPTSVLYYIVTATDVHDNQSQASNEASVSGTTGVGHTPALTALTVQPNVPNPFNASTDLEIGLPAAAPVEITVYDVAGRRVREMEVAGVAGWQAVPFSGRDARGRALASGVYFYRVNWDGVTVTRKMVIER